MIALAAATENQTVLNGTLFAAVPLALLAGWRVTGGQLCQQTQHLFPIHDGCPPAFPFPSVAHSGSSKRWISIR